MLAKDEISRMSSTERMEVMELLWESFSKEGIDYPSPDWHGNVLTEGSAIIDSGKALGVRSMSFKPVCRTDEMERPNQSRLQPLPLPKPN